MCDRAPAPHAQGPAAPPPALPSRAPEAPATSTAPTPPPCCHQASSAAAPEAPPSTATTTTATPTAPPSTAPTAPCTPTADGCKYNPGCLPYFFDAAVCPAALPWIKRAWGHVFGFNHEEACDCAARAIEANPGCAFAHVTMAYARGCDYNNPYGLCLSTAATHAEAALRLLEARPHAATAMEADFIRATHARFLPEPPAGDDGTARARLQRAYADAMRGVAARHPGCPDVAYLFVESLMNLRPWQLWDRSDPHDIRPSFPETLEALAAIEAALAAHPEHQGLCHMYIHLHELGPTPAKALPQADLLFAGLAKEHGHLLHMPSHTYTWVGEWRKATLANMRAVEADAKYVQITGNRVNRFLGYRVHNMHFAVWSASFEARRGECLRYARLVEAELDRAALDYCLGEVPVGRLYNEAYLPIMWHVLIRFGMWDAILARPLPADRELHATTFATALYARGIALASLGRVAEAEAAVAAFMAALESPHLRRRFLRNNPIYDTSGKEQGIMNVAVAMLLGELEYRKGNYDVAFAHLREAVRRDVGLQYDEPWGWMMPTRHALGALLLEQRCFEESAAVFKADLDMYPKNIWGLQGLSSALQGIAPARLPHLGLGVDQPALAADLAHARAVADVPVQAACFCATSQCCSAAANAAAAASALNPAPVDRVPLRTLGHAERSYIYRHHNNASC